MSLSNKGTRETSKGFRVVPAALIFIVLTLGLLAVACGDDEEPTTAPAPTATSGDTMMLDPTATEAMMMYKGEIAVSGSSTVFPISEAMQVEFNAV